MFSENFIQSDDGLNLYYRVYAGFNDDISTTPIICLPGLTRNSQDFDKLATFLSQKNANKHQVICVDYRGRGRSDWDDKKENYNIFQEAQDILSLLEHLKIDKASFIGTSRGGLILLVLATLKQNLFEKVIFNDIGPELDINGLLDIKNYLTSSRTPNDWDDAAQLQKQMHGKQFPDLSIEDWEDMARQIYKEHNKTIIANFDPAIAQALESVNENMDLPDMWEQYDHFSNIPTMSIRGRNSTLFTKSIQDKMAVKNSNHLKVVIDNQGHPPILHMNGLAEKVASFLSDT